MDNDKVNFSKDTLWGQHFSIPIKLPDNNQEQIKKISEELQRCKKAKRLTLDQAIKALPSKYRYSRTAINAYLHGTVKTPPDRDFLIALFRSLNLNTTELSYSLKICGYAGLEKDHAKDLSRDLVMEFCHRKGKALSDEQIEKLTEYACSVFEMAVEKLVDNG